MKFQNKNNVIPAHAGIQYVTKLDCAPRHLDSGMRRNDERVVQQ